MNPSVMPRGASARTPSAPRRSGPSLGLRSVIAIAVLLGSASATAVARSAGVMGALGSLHLEGRLPPSGHSASMESIADLGFHCHSANCSDRARGRFGRPSFRACFTVKNSARLVSGLLDIRGASSFPAERFAPFDIVELNPKPGLASVCGSIPCAATALRASGRTDDRPFANQDSKGASHTCDVRGTDLVGFKLICEGCQFAYIKAAVRIDQREQRSLQGFASAAHNCYVLRDRFQNITLKADPQAQSGNIVNAASAQGSRTGHPPARTERSGQPGLTVTPLPILPARVADPMLPVARI
jgi:hypothetical protein